MIRRNKGCPYPSCLKSLVNIFSQSMQISIKNQGSDALFIFEILKKWGDTLGSIFLLTRREGFDNLVPESSYPQMSNLTT